jgi:flagellar motility protein MotE (MotC chaperone)
LVSIPGISPQKFAKPVLASPNPTGGFLSSFALPLKNLAQAEKSTEASIKPPPPLEAKASKLQPELGDIKLAELWNEMEPAKLASITEKWPPASLAKILVKMDPDQVAAYLATLKTTRATQLSKAIQQAASIPTSPAAL